MPIDPELEKVGKQLFRQLAQVGLKAALSGLDSALSDVGGALKEGVRRVDKTRTKVRRRIQETEPARPYTNDEEEE